MVLLVDQLGSCWCEYIEAIVCLLMISLKQMSLEGVLVFIGCNDMTNQEESVFFFTCPHTTILN